MNFRANHAFGGSSGADLVNPVDWDVFYMPDQLLWLYPLLRPVGWLVRNVRRWRAAARRTPSR